MQVDSLNLIIMCVVVIKDDWPEFVIFNLRTEIQVNSAYFEIQVFFLFN